jgi:hypothetical protein
MKGMTMAQICSQVKPKSKLWKTILMLSLVLAVLVFMEADPVSAQGQVEMEPDIPTIPALDPTMPPPGLVHFPIRINFQPETGPIKDGFELDFGEEFGERVNGFIYGWNKDNRGNAHRRNQPGSPDVIYDTLIYLQRGGRYNWEIALDNREYYVIVVAGDPSYIDSQINIQVEGMVLVEGVPTANNPWVKGSAFVTVTDGRLTLSNGEGALNNKINYIEITALGLVDDPEFSMYSLHLPLVSRR